MCVDHCASWPRAAPGARKDDETKTLPSGQPDVLAAIGDAAVEWRPAVVLRGQDNESAAQIWIERDMAAAVSCLSRPHRGAAISLPMLAPASVIMSQIRPLFLFGAQSSLVRKQHHDAIALGMARDLDLAEHPIELSVAEDFACLPTITPGFL
jgi:hypothetical protein